VLVYILPLIYLRSLVFFNFPLLKGILSLFLCLLNPNEHTATNISTKQKDITKIYPVVLSTTGEGDKLVKFACGDGVSIAGEPRINLDDGATEAASVGNTTSISSIGDGASKGFSIGNDAFKVLFTGDDAFKVLFTGDDAFKVLFTGDDAFKVLFN